MSVPRVLDVRALPPDEWRSSILAGLEALGVDESLIAVGGADVKPVLAEIQAAQQPPCDWTLLEAGPERVRVEVRRRPDGQGRTISGYLARDHDRLDDVLREVERLLGDRRETEARESFAEFCCGLDRHITVEEEILFPHFERESGITQGPTVVMRAEHGKMRQWMDAASTALAGGQGAAFTDAVDQLKALLESHNTKEELILYPMAERVTVSREAQDALVRRMQAIE
ncbi:MAG TPA: hemerythrin domain-containing protein [Gammaproteobacteria bacterium]